MHPFKIITGGLSNLFTLAIIGLDIYLFREWYNFKDSINTNEYAQRCLIFAGVLLAIFLFGGLVFRFLLGKRGKDNPNMDRSSEVIELQRPEGNTIHVEFYGNKDLQPIILIHGWSSDSTQWYYLKKHLSKSFRLIVYDLPGLGKSTKVKNKDYSLNKFAADLNEVIALTGSKKPIVLGHSIGGMTILTYCKNFSSELHSKVAGLVLVQTTYTNPVKTAIFSKLLTALQKPVLAPIARLMIVLSPVLQIMNWIKYFNSSQHFMNHITGFGGTETKGQLNHVTLLSTKASVDVVSRGCLAMFEYDATHTLATIKVPVLIIAGNKDILTKKEASEYMNAHIPNTQLEILQPSGHMGPMERNEEMIDVVEKWGRTISFKTTERARIDVESQLIS